jgi:hypothetical protein
MTLRATYAVACALGLAAFFAAPGRALGQDGRCQGQEGVVYPADALAYQRTHRPHWWCNCLMPNDGIPRTYSYYYSTWLNQPHHFRVVGPDGRAYWRTTVRGYPMGLQWLAP